MRLIDADRLEKYCRGIDATYNDEPWMLVDILSAINDMPTVDAKPVVHGTWLYNRINSPDFRICDKCGCPYRISKIESKYNYCPNCGADMRERKDNDKRK